MADTVAKKSQEQPTSETTGGDQSNLVQDQTPVITDNDNNKSDSTKEVEKSLVEKPDGSFTEVTKSPDIKAESTLLSSPAKVFVSYFTKF